MNRASDVNRALWLVVMLVALVAVIAPGAWVAVAEAAPAAAAVPVCPELPCSVNRNCSSTGVACEPDDRACTEKARTDNLEVKCEQECSSGKRLVYCPPDTGRSDSKIVWILLSFAVLLASAGSILAWAVLRKKA